MSRYSGDVRGRNEILVLTRDPDTERAITLAAEGDAGVFGRVTVCRELSAFEGELGRRPQTRVALVDVDPQPLSFLAGLEPIVRRHPYTAFVVICADFENRVVLEAMQVGARNCLLKSSLSQDLLSVLRRLLEGSAAAAPRADGRLITVMTASGGAGGTTLSINLADELRLSSGQPALLVDLDLDYGAAAAYLGLNPEYGIADVLNTHGSIDAQLIRSTALAHADDLHVLTSPASSDSADAGGLDYEQLETVLGVCREAYPHTVIDAPRTPRDVAARLAQASDLTLLVFQLSVIDVRSARAQMRAMTARGAPAERILPVANRWVKRSRMLSLEDARDALGGVEVVSVSNDFENTLRSINYGQPLSRVAPRSPVRRDLGRIVERIAATADGREERR